MKFDIYGGDYVGSAEWEGPGRVALDMPEGSEKAWFANYFRTEDSFLTGSIGFEEMASESPDSSEEAFARAAFQLAAYRYTVQQAEERERFAS